MSLGLSALKLNMASNGIPRLKDIYDELLQVLLQLSDCQCGLLIEIFQNRNSDFDSRTLSVSSLEGTGESFVFKNIQVAKELIGNIVLDEKHLVISDAEQIEKFVSTSAGSDDIFNFIGIPLLSRKRTLAVVCLLNRSEGFDSKFINDIGAWKQSCIQTMNLRSDSAAVEKSLYEKEVQQRAILDNTLDAVITINESGTVIAANKAVEVIFGYTAEDLINENVKILAPEPVRSNHDTYLSNYLSSGKARIIGIVRETYAQRKDNTQVAIDIAVTEFKLHGNRFFTGIIRDITKRKEFEEEAAKAWKALEKSRDDLILVLNQLRIGTIVIDESETIAFISDNCETIEGINGQEAIGKPWRQALPFDEYSKSKLEELLNLPATDRSRTVLTMASSTFRKYQLEVDVWDDPRNTLRHIVCLYDMTEVYQLRDEVKKNQYHRMIGNSRPMLEMYETFEQVARGEWTVLIEGETGAGKELVARSIHGASTRRNGPFIAVNCAGLTESLLADQLFGHRKGAFTGAISDQQGFFEAASGGTLFLDEIGDIPLQMQSSLLRVLQEHEIIRIGETKPRKVDVRILAATNKDLGELARVGGFREDLLYRIRVARILVPPLRERLEDIPMLVEAFLAESRIASGKPGVSMGQPALQKLMGYHWPGNVRELKNAVDHCVIHCRQSEIIPHDLPPEILNPPVSHDLKIDYTPFEQKKIMAALEKAAGNRTKAARLLGMSRSTFYRRLSQLGIEYEK